MNRSRRGLRYKIARSLRRARREAGKAAAAMRAACRLGSFHGEPTARSLRRAKQNEHEPMPIFKLLAPMAVAFVVVHANAEIDSVLAPLPAEVVATVQTKIAPATRAYTLDSSALLGELEKELAARLSLTGDLKLTLAQPWKPVKLPGADFAVSIVELPQGGIAGMFALHVKVTSGGELAGDWQMSLRAQLWQEVWIAAARLDRGQALDRTLLATQKVDVLREHQQLLSAEVDPAGLEVAQTISASRALTKRDVIERPLVRRGQVVDVVAERGRLNVSMKALALESGAAGELIRLRNIESRKEFSAQILNENKVQVHF